MMSRFRPHGKGNSLEQLQKPRVLKPDADFTIFEYQEEVARGKNHNNGYSRKDQLVIPERADVLIDVQWRNRRLALVRGTDLTDPFDTSASFDDYFQSLTTLFATLSLEDEAMERLWAEQGKLFDQSPTSIGRGETAQAEYRRLLLGRLAVIKLIVATPANTFIASAEPTQKGQISFEQFRVYNWELFSGLPQVTHRLFVPDDAEVEALSARFFVEDWSGGVNNLDVLSPRPLVPA